MSQTGYKSTETHVGKALMEVRSEALDKAMEEETQLTKDTYYTEEDVELPAATFGVDM